MQCSFQLACAQQLRLWRPGGAPQALQGQEVQRMKPVLQRSLQERQAQQVESCVRLWEPQLQELRSTLVLLDPRGADQLLARQIMMLAA